KHEVSALTHGAPDEGRGEARLQEAPGDGEPELTAYRPGFDAIPGTTMSDEDVDARAVFAAHLRPSAFPAAADSLVETARAEHAPNWVVEELSRLDSDGEFENVQAVWHALGHPVEPRHP